MNLRDAVISIIKNNVSFKGIRLGTVKSVDDSTRTCVVNVLESETDIEGVRLHITGESANGAYYKPKVNSLIGIMPIFEFEYCAVLFSELESVSFLDGSYGGLIKINDLVTKVNNLENQVNDLLTALQGITIPLAPSGTYPFAPLFASFDPLTPTEASEIENTKITHGTV